MDESAPVVVVSAMSDGNKTVGTTARLLRMVACIEESRPDEIQAEMKELYEYHANMATNSLSSDAAAEFHATLQRVVKRLKEFINAAMVLHEVSPRTRDVIVSVGESLSAMFLATYLEDQVTI
ncbi:Aspartokinase [Paramicrosporidium saccamoebae]|uniref:Aspartokinase n=1 Tax=Paramicrosporidium saccamoebae TaxID=1246581 RepID=A0A2H9TGP3_9FUNG|nr:Aspartokinase [Paramicrosporidium saccamoebae]